MGWSPCPGRRGWTGSYAGRLQEGGWKGAGSLQRRGLDPLQAPGGSADWTWRRCSPCPRDSRRLDRVDEMKDRNGQRGVSQPFKHTILPFQLALMANGRSNCEADEILFHVIYLALWVLLKIKTVIKRVFESTVPTHGPSPTRWLTAVDAAVWRQVCAPRPQPGPAGALLSLQAFLAHHVLGQGVVLGLP